MHLSVKPLVKFKSVCKQWNSIISDPQFIVNHACKKPRPNGLLLKTLNSPSLSLVPLEVYHPPKVFTSQFLNDPDIVILYSCKDFLCYSVSNNMSNNLDVVLAHNLDDSIRTSYFVCYFTRICAFDKPSVANFVRQISSLELNRLIKIEIYSLETRSWKLEVYR